MNRYIRAAARLARTLPADLVAAWGRSGPAGLRRVLRARVVRRIYRRLDLLLLEIDVPGGCGDPGGAAGLVGAADPGRAPRDAHAPPGSGRPDRADEPPADGRIRAFGGPWSRLASIPGQVPLRRLEDWSRGGMTCLLAERDGVPVGYVWVDPGFRGSRYPAAPELPADAVYLRNLYVERSERGRGLGTALVAAGLRLAAQGGYRRARYTVRPDNDPSRRAFARAAGVPPRLVGRLVYVRLLDRRLRRFVPVRRGRPG